MSFINWRKPGWSIDVPVYVSRYQHDSPSWDSAYRFSSGSWLAVSCRLVLTRMEMACCFVMLPSRGPSKKHAMRRRGGKLVPVTATAIEWLRALADPQSVNSGQEGRCELCWRPGAPMAPSGTLSDRAVRPSPIPW